MENGEGLRSGNGLMYAREDDGDEFINFELVKFII